MVQRFAKMRRLLLSVAFSAVIVAAPFVADRVWPAAPPFLVIPLYPGLYCAAVLFDLAGWQLFDQSGDFPPSFTIAMIGFSFASWFVLCYGLQRFLRVLTSGTARHSP